MFKYESQPNPNKTVSGQWVFEFENGYGASVISGYGAYGNSISPYELAVIRWVGDKFELDYTTPITDDVIGYNTLDEINELLDQIKNLPPIKE
jgi:hypothetical protein